MAQSTRNIETLIADGGDINIGAPPPHECAATAADGSNCLAMLVRRGGETFNALLKRLDKAIGMAWSDDLFIDEVNDGESDLLGGSSWIIALLALAALVGGIVIASDNNDDAPTSP